MIVKVHRTSEGRKIISICDKEIIGEKFHEKNLQLDLSSDFYEGEEKTEDEIKKLVEGGYILNIAGEKSVGFCLKQGWISKNNIIRIKKIPHAQSLFVGD